MIRLERVYEPPSQEDGLRILVDRLWPRALKRDAAQVDLWLKDVAPGAALRQWFGHDPGRWTEFGRRYRRELAERPEAVAALRALVKANKRLTLLFAAKDSDHNNAVALKNFLGRRTARRAHSAAGRAAGR